MTTTLPDSTGMLVNDPIDKIGKLIRLMASTLDGECLNSVRALDGVLHSVGADFHFLADIVRANWQDPEAVVIQMRPRPEWQTLASELLKHPEILLDKEFTFLANMSRSPYPPTPKQTKWLLDVESRLPRREAKPS